MVDRLPLNTAIPAYSHPTVWSISVQQPTTAIQAVCQIFTQHSYIHHTLIQLFSISVQQISVIPSLASYRLINRFLLNIYVAICKTILSSNISLQFNRPCSVIVLTTDCSPQHSYQAILLLDSIRYFSTIKNQVILLCNCLFLSSHQQSYISRWCLTKFNCL